MDSFEFNKIAGGVLAALLLAFGSGTVIEIFGGSGHGDHDKVGYKLEVKAAAADGGAAKPAKAAFDPAKVVAQVAKADAGAGAGVFARCKSCHSIDKSGKSTPTGPNLWGIVGRKMGGSSTFTRYSSVFKGKDGKWDYKSLVGYLRDPRGFLPGNRMSFAGIKDEGQLASLIAYLRTLSDKPAPLP